MEDMDPGLARERTELAWTRTALSFAALGATIFRVSAVAGLLVLAGALLVWGIGHLPGRGERQVAGDRRRMLLITVSMAVVSGVALAVALMAGRSPLIPW